MPAITIHLDEALEERDRDQRRKTRKAFAISITIAILGVGASLRTPPPKIIHDVLRVPYPVERQGPPLPPRIVSRIEHLPPADPPAPRFVLVGGGPSFGSFPQRGVVETVDPSTRHLCLSPRTTVFCGAGTQHVTISNPSLAAVAITDITAATNRRKSGFGVDTSDCLGRRLEPGDRCTLAVTLRENAAETLELEIAHDAGGQPEVMTIVAREQ